MGYKDTKAALNSAISKLQVGDETPFEKDILFRIEFLRILFEINGNLDSLAVAARQIASAVGGIEHHGNKP